MACVDMPGEMVEIGLVAVSCNAVMLVRGVITLLAAGATKSPLPTVLALFLLERRSMTIVFWNKLQHIILFL